MWSEEGDDCRTYWLKEKISKRIIDNNDNNNNTEHNDDNNERDNNEGDINNDQDDSDDNNNNTEHENVWKILVEELSLAMKLTITFFKMSRISRRNTYIQTAFSFDINFLTNDIDLYKPSSVALQDIIYKFPEISYG